MRYTPSLGNWKVKNFCQFLGSRRCHGVSPSPEWYQKFLILVKRHIAMHHGRNSHGAYSMQCNIIFLIHILF